MGDKGEKEVVGEYFVNVVQTEVISRDTKRSSDLVTKGCNEVPS